MVLLDLDFTLPLKNPVIIFSLVLFIILFAPILLNKVKIPYIIGLILAGVLIGPYGLNLLLRDSSIVLFGTVGLLYIMFLAGLEIDLSEFKKSRNKIIVFGLVTFILPLVVGTLASYYVLGYNFLSSILLASMFSTHTLISYPIASRYGISRNRAVTLTIGGTMITDILALLILAGIAGMTKGDVSSSFWVTLGISSIIFVCIIFFIFPLIIRWFFTQFDDGISQYVFVLAIVFLASFLAEAAGIEPIIGAFFSGLVLNRFIPHSSPLMNRIDFVGNALFIPFFLIGVGMLVDLTVLVKGWGALKVAGVIVLVAVVTKYIAARFTEKVFRLSANEGRMIFGLSTSHAAATLAIILVGYNIIIGETPTGEPIRLLNEDVLNGTIILILVSCALSSFIVERASRQIALTEDHEIIDSSGKEGILISLAYPDMATELVDLGLMIKPKKSSIPVYALHVVSDEADMEKTSSAGKRMLDKVIRHAAASDNTIQPLTRFDMNISNGIIYTIKEYNITDVIIGLHHQAMEREFFGRVGERLFRRTSETIYVYKPFQPVNTIRRMVVVIPPKAQYEPGFYHWVGRLCNFGKESGFPIVMYAQPDTIIRLKHFNEQRDTPLSIQYNEFSDWNEFLIFSKEVKENDLFVIVTSRKGYLSYQPVFERLPSFLSKYFKRISFIILYPAQMDDSYLIGNPSFDPSMMNPIEENLDIINKAGNYVKKIFTGPGDKKDEK